MFTRVPDGYRPTERRRGLILIAAVIGAIYLIFTAMSTVWTDYLWFDSVGFTEVWWLRWLVSIGLGVAGGLFTFLLVWGNLVLVDRMSPRYETLQLGGDEEVVIRFREWVEPRLRWVRLGIAAAFAVLLGIGVASWRDQVLLFANGGSFGSVDPQFGIDIGFYVFRLPVWSLLLSWVFNLLILTLLLVVAMHYLNGGIQVERGSFPTMRRPVKAHISVLLALLALTRAIMYRVDALELVYAPSGYFGAGYADINARLPAFALLALVAVLGAILFIVNIWRDGWTLAVVSVVGWLFVSIGAAFVYPAVIQRFTVQPNELARERPYIVRNIEATRAAFDLDDIEVREFPATTELTARDIEDSRLTIDNLRLWDPEVINRTYSQLQEIRQYYRVDRVDTDRYTPPGGVPTQALVAVRELDEPNIPAQDWQNQRLAYTHGLGAVLSPANAVLSNGQPDFLLRDVPPVTSLEFLQVEQPRIYFGETYDPNRPVIVRTGSGGGQEIDFPTGGESGGATLNQYDGAAGVELSSIFRRLAFALRYRDLNILISSQLRPDSRVLMERNILERVDRIAPFLAADSDPYPVVLDGRILWVLDMYTISDHYPYSQPIGTRNFTSGRLSRASQLPLGGFNYIRNSVKATVDAYDGAVRLYIVDEADPVVQAWRSVYPAIFLDMASMPERLEQHLRYPQDLFIVQSELYLDYHMVDATQFFQRSDAWAIPADPSTVRRSELLRGDRRSATDPTRVDYLRSFLPSYLLFSLPGEDSLTYGLMQPFNPEDKPNMSAFLLADSTPGRYGRLVDLRMPRGSLVDGTGQVGNRIDQDEEISQQFTLWRGQGSNVLLGAMLVVPINDSIMYVQPVYLEAEAGGIPEFRRVIVVYGDQVEWDDTLDAVLEKVFGEADLPGPESPDDLPPEPPSGTSIEELLEQASAAFEEARAALRRGDLATYQEKVEEAERLVEEARLLFEDAAEARRHNVTVG
jgi:uncharacterized protein